MESLLLDLGFEEGASVEIRHQGPFGGPLAVRVDDRLIALRPDDAAAILVDPDLVGPDRVGLDTADYGTVDKASAAGRTA